MTTYSVIIGSPPGGSILPSGAFGSLGWLTKASTPAERLNMAFKFGNSGRMSKSGCMKARYSISATSPGLGQVANFQVGKLFRKGVAPCLRVADTFVEINKEQRHVLSVGWVERSETRHSWTTMVVSPGSTHPTFW